jgi:hypothetical protein
LCGHKAKQSGQHRGVSNIIKATSFKEPRFLISWNRFLFSQIQPKESTGTGHQFFSDAPQEAAKPCPPKRGGERKSFRPQRDSFFKKKVPLGQMKTTRSQKENTVIFHLPQLDGCQFSENVQHVLS